MSTPQLVAVPYGIVGLSGGEAPRWPRRPLGTVAFRAARVLLLLAAFAFGSTHPLGHVAREMERAMKLV